LECEWRVCVSFTDALVIIIIIHAFITRASSVMILIQRCWWAAIGKSVNGLGEKVSFQTAFEGVKSG